MLGQMAKDDFENVFLAEEGQDYARIRNGSLVGAVRGLASRGMIQCKAEADVRVGDVLRSDLQNRSFLVEDVSFEVVGSIRTCLEAHVSEV